MCEVSVAGSMFSAAFFKTADGDFDIGGLVLILMGAWFAIGIPLMLRRFVRTRRIPIGYSGMMGSTIFWIEREKHPIGFWVVFCFWCVLAIAGVGAIGCGWFGYGRSTV